MKVYLFKDHADTSEYAAKVLIDQLKTRPNLVLGLATGSTPIELYQLLIKAFQDHEISFQDVITFNLDEYLGIPADHPQSYARFMHEQLFSSIDIRKHSVHIPDGTSQDPDQVGRAYEEAIRQAGGIDLQILGLGNNGHIGFNEPDEELQNYTHATHLTQETRQANARFFGSIEDVPTDAITMGMGTILRAGKIVLLASGEHKADAVQKTVEGGISTRIPASLLQLHPDVLVLVDRAAGSKLNPDSYEVR